MSIIPFFLTNWQEVVHRGRNEPRLSPPMPSKEVEGMPSWKGLIFKIINTIFGGKKRKVKMTCSKETIPLSFPSSEVMKSTESSWGCSWDSKLRRESWALGEMLEGLGPGPGQVKPVVIGRSTLQITSPGELWNRLAWGTETPEITLRTS